MSLFINQHPSFDLLEIEPELLFQLKKYRALTPAKKGDGIPDLTFCNDLRSWRKFVNGGESHDYLSARKLLSKPLVVAFYSQQWNEQGLAHLKQLNELNTEIKANGGNLVVVTDSRPQALAKTAWDFNLTLNFYLDPDHQLATQFGVYDKQSPLWERFSGIDAHIPLLAAFVVTPHHSIVFDYSNWNSEKPLDSATLLEGVYQAGICDDNRKSA